MKKKINQTNQQTREQLFAWSGTIIQRAMMDAN